jgi:hypothetical protein
VDGETLTAESCLRRAGFDLGSVGVSSVIPAPPGGVWGGPQVLEELHRAMTASAQSSLDEPAFEAHVLLLSSSDRPGLLGVMYDLDTLPRQGCAVFIDEIRRRFPGDDAEKRVVQWMVHEIGHVLNLTHRFETGNWDSTSFMNYPGAFRGGRHEQEFEDLFDFNFDPDELAFLRHGPRGSVIPGGAAFGTNTYWLRSAGAGASPVDATCLRLWLTSNDEGADPVTYVPLGQPVYLSVSLGNAGYRPVVLPRHALDVKSGMLDVAITKLGDGAAEQRMQRFVPVTRRCYQVDNPRLVRLEAGQSMHDNLNLALGTSGPPFKEPGEYELTPVLSIPAGDPDEPGRVVRVTGRAVKLRVTENPHEELRTQLQSAAFAAGLAVGSFTAAGTEPEAVEEFLAKPAVDGERLRAAVRRTRALEAARRGAFAEAAEQLELATAGPAAHAFDPHTIEHTKRAARRFAARARQQPEREAPSVVVDLAIGTGAERTASRLAGQLQVDAKGYGWGVLAPGASLPAALMDTENCPAVEATVTVAAPDGLTEVIPVLDVKLAGPGAGKEPELVMLTLPRTIPGWKPSAPPDQDRFSARRLADHETAWQMLADEGVVPSTPAGDDELDAWAGAATGALARRQLPRPAGTANVSRPRNPDFGDVGGWACWLLHCKGKDRSADSEANSPLGRDYPYSSSSEPAECIEPRRSTAPDAPDAPDGEESSP